MRIGVYTGQTDKINIDGITFDRNTPTYIAPYMVETIFKRDDFHLYNPKEEYEGHKRHIYVNMPSDFRLFVGAINVLKRIKQCFPLSPIVCSCNLAWASIIGDLATCSNSYDSQMKREQYREFNLHISDDEIPRYLNRWKNFSIEQILLEKIQLWETPIDMGARPKHLGINKETKEVIVFHNGDNPDKTWLDLSKALSDVSEYIHIGKARYEKQIIDEYLELFSKAAYIIVCGESKISFLAAFSGAKCMIISDNDTWDKDKRLKMMGAKGGTFGNLPNVKTVLDALDGNISKQLNKINIKPPTEKRPEKVEIMESTPLKDSTVKPKRKKKRKQKED